MDDLNLMRTKVEMKFLLSLIILVVSTHCFSQTNRQRLEDIEDRLEMMEYEQLLKQVQRNIELSPYIPPQQPRNAPVNEMAKIGVDFESSYHFIDEKTVSRKSLNVVSFNVLINFSSPRRIDSSNAQSKKKRVLYKLFGIKNFCYQRSIFYREGWRRKGS